MVTIAYLKEIVADSQSRECSNIPQPEAFEFSGFYPTQWCIRYHLPSHTVRISVDQFVWRESDSISNNNDDDDTTSEE